VMIFKYILPSSHLKEYVKEYCFFHFILDQKISVPLKPYPACPEQGITFYIKGYLVSNSLEFGTSEKRAQIVIFGQPLTRQDLQLSNEYMMINIRFHPGALYKILRIPMSEFVNKNVDAELVLGREIREVNERLSNALCYEEMLNIVESYLWDKIKKIKDEIHPIDKIGNFILEDPQLFNLKKIARQACLSPSQFERKFIQQIGVNPKFFARVCRFSQAFALKERNQHLSWLDIAWKTGYTDYQHLVKDFKQFSGSTPNILINESTQAPERWLGLIK
ncbi:MAG: helix-turn-helix domain-containing protein, partial [Chitinophagaceae bacterium]